MLTTGTFTGDARKEATRDGVPPIELVDGRAACTNGVVALSLPQRIHGGRRQQRRARLEHQLAGRTG